MKKLLTILLLFIAIATTSNTLLSLQDPNTVGDDAARQRAEQGRQELNRRAAEAAAQAQLERDRVQAEQEARRRIQHEAELVKLMEQARQRRAQENEAKHVALRKDAKEFIDVSVKFHNELQKSGAQAVSVSFYSDLDKLEKLVKAIRKNSK